MSTWQTTTTTYAQIKRTAKRKVTCETCGRKFSRQRTFSNTINPFNKNDRGFPKTYDEVLADVIAMARVWQPEQDCGNHEV
jgi:hypothetical protein